MEKKKEDGLCYRGREISVINRQKKEKKNIKRKQIFKKYCV